MSEDCKDFIRHLTKKNPEQRLGHENDVEDVITHAWFKEYNRRAFEAKKYTPEYLPKISENVLDDSNFDPEVDKHKVDFSVLGTEALNRITENNDKFALF